MLQGAPGSLHESVSRYMEAAEQRSEVISSSSYIFRRATSADSINKVAHASSSYELRLFQIRPATVDRAKKCNQQFDRVWRECLWQYIEEINEIILSEIFQLNPQ